MSKLSCRACRRALPIFVFFLLAFPFSGMVAHADDPTSKSKEDNYRPPANEADLRYWLQNMVWHHHFSTGEIMAATGLTSEEISRALNRLDITPANKPKRSSESPLLVLPYPGGRHPRFGFLEGAIRPQRETKASVFTPWDESSYVVVDVPEAIRSNLGLLYLAHTHVPTVWTEAGVELEPLEWRRGDKGLLDISRKLPNGVVFATRIQPARDGVYMEIKLTNGSTERLTGLKVQNCVMLKGAKGFESQTNDNKRFQGPNAACASADGKRWIITAWEPVSRAWGNAKCPCLHSDPKFPDCAPGETARITGWLSFYEGPDFDKELARLDKIGWRTWRSANEK